MTVAPPHPFDADTALEPAGDGRWRASAPEHWFVARGPNGGYLAAVAARAAEAAAGRPLRSLTLHFADAARRRAARRARDGRARGPHATRRSTLRIEQAGGR